MSEKEIVFCKSGGCTAKLGAGGREKMGGGNESQIRQIEA